MGKSTTFPRIVLWASALCSFCGLLVGGAHIVSSLGTWCDDGESSDGSFSCLGPWLVWNTRSSFSHDSNAVGWRQFFTFSPDIALAIWSPLLLPILTFLFQVPAMEWALPAKNWSVFSLWHLFVALFGTFGYGGNMGVITGIALIVVCILSLIVIFSGEERAPASFGFLCEVEEDDTEKKDDESDVDDSDCDSDDEGEEDDDDSDDDKRWYLCKQHSQNSVAFIKLVAMVNSLLTLIVGVVHVANNFSSFCRKSEDMHCVGPLLEYHIAVEDFFKPSNVRWRNQISMVPTTFFDTFSPLIFGVFMLACYPKKLGFYHLVPNWVAMTVVYLLMAIFANFGYAGNFGILVGFLSTFVSFASLLIVLTDNTHVAPFDHLDSRTRNEGDEEDEDEDEDDVECGGVRSRRTSSHVDDACTLVSHMSVCSEAQYDEEKLPTEEEAERNIHDEHFGRFRRQAREQRDWGNQLHQH